MNVELAYYLSAFSLGILGGFHCAGMCGPIAIMLPQTSGSAIQILYGRTIYNSGRVITYVLIGLLAGVLGWAISLKNFQREFSIGLGIVLLISLVFSIKYNFDLRLNMTGSNLIRSSLKKLFSKRTKASLFLIGVLNGLLPCGLVYVAIAGSASAGSITGSMAYMLIFGLGTFPMMMAVSFFTNYISSNYKIKLSRLSMVMTLILALVLIFRGMNLSSEHCSNIQANKNTPVYCKP